MFYYFSTLIFGLSPFLRSILLSSLRRLSQISGLGSFKLRVSPLAILCFLPLALSLGPVAHVYSAQVTLQWDANTDPIVAGYKVYYGTASGNYPYNIDVGKATTYTASNLQDGVTYYFATTDYDTSGMESGFSNEVVLNATPTCTYSLSSTAQSFGSSAGTGNVVVTTGAGCSWTAIRNANATWITITSNGSATGPSTVNYSVASNPSSSSRSGTMTIAGQTFTVTQSGGACSYSLSPTSQSFTSTGGTGSISVTAASGCSWTTSSTASWITINSGSSGSGNGPINFSVAANTTSSSRSGSLSIAGQTFTVSQAGVSQYTLTVNKTGTGNGTITTSPTGTAFNAGTVVTLTATPDGTSAFAGWSGGYTGASATCSVTVSGNTSVTAAFNLKTFTITASAGGNGSTSPPGVAIVNYGASQSFAITPAKGYAVSDVQVDGASVGAVTSYVFGNVMANHTIAASFKALPPPVRHYKRYFSSSTKTFTINADAGKNGSISPQGASAVDYGVSQSFTITPAKGYVVSDVQVDGVSVGAVTSYLFGNVTANHTIAARFKALPHSVRDYKRYSPSEPRAVR